MELFIIFIAAILGSILHTKSKSSTVVTTGTHYHYYGNTKPNRTIAKPRKTINSLTQKEFVNYMAKKKIICL